MATEDREVRRVYRERLGNLLPELGAAPPTFVQSVERVHDGLSERQKLQHQAALFAANQRLLDVFSHTKMTSKTVDEILKAELTALRARRAQHLAQLRASMEADPVKPTCIEVEEGGRRPFLRLREKRNQLKTLSASRMRATLEGLEARRLLDVVESVLP